ncbi:MAG TPA: carboxypeptidase regulatory-like domain-containing protein [Pyrinomonadaceae bacterium]|nr:carboxypeptidase regulatory-like domain-containing protein [Pyrinomonadaceae bacterium]
MTGGVSGASAWFGSDPAMAWDNAGNAYAVYMLVNQNSAGTSSGSAIVIAKSTDSGTTWSNLGVIVNHETVANPFDDKEMVVVDTTVGKANSHTGRIYVIWDENNVERVAFSDNGTTWTTVVMGSGTEIGGNIAIGPDGTVWAAWNHYSQTGGVGAGDSLYVKKSTDGGVTWTAPANNPIVQHNLASFGSNNKPAAQDSRGINAFPIIDVDRNPASSNFGKIYIAYSDFPPSTGSGNDLNVYLVSSGNGGASWSPQVLVNDDGGTSTQFFPWMSVDQSDGTVNLSWLDTRNFSANNQQTQTYTARSVNGGASFEQNVSVEDTGANFRNNVSFSDDNTTDNSARNGNQYGDYEGVAAANRISHPLWTDTRNFYPSSDTASPARAEDAVTTTLTNCSAPSSVAAPTGTATGCGLQLSWSVPAGWGSNATGGTYSLYRSTTSTFPGGTPLASGLTAASYTDTTGTPGITYFYFVEARNNCPGMSLTPMSTVSTASAATVFPACGPSGVLQGTVTTGGSPVGGATVSAGIYTTATNASGFYQFPSISVGTYSVTASATGYNSATANNVSVTQNTCDGAGLRADRSHDERLLHRHHPARLRGGHGEGR